MGRVSLRERDQRPELQALRREQPHLAVVPAQVTNAVLTRLDLAYDAAFRRLRAGQPPGFPRFRAWPRMAVALSAQTNELVSVRRRHAYLRVSDGSAAQEPFGALRLRLHRPLPDDARLTQAAITHKAACARDLMRAPDPELVGDDRRAPEAPRRALARSDQAPRRRSRAPRSAPRDHRGISARIKNAQRPAAITRDRTGQAKSRTATGSANFD